MRRTPDRSPAWLSISGYAAHYHLSRNTVKKLLEEGLLVFWRVRGLIRIKRQPPFDHRPAGPQPTS